MCLPTKTAYMLELLIKKIKWERFLLTNCIRQEIEDLAETVRRERERETVRQTPQREVLMHRMLWW